MSFNADTDQLRPIDDPNSQTPNGSRTAFQTDSPAHASPGAPATSSQSSGTSAITSACSPKTTTAAANTSSPHSPNTSDSSGRVSAQSRVSFDASRRPGLSQPSLVYGSSGFQDYFANLPVTFDAAARVDAADRFENPCATKPPVQYYGVTSDAAEHRQKGLATIERPQTKMESPYFDSVQRFQSPGSRKDQITHAHSSETSTFLEGTSRETGTEEVRDIGPDSSSDRVIDAMAKLQVSPPAPAAPAAALAPDAMAKLHVSPPAPAAPAPAAAPAPVVRQTVYFLRPEMENQRLMPETIDWIKKKRAFHLNGIREGRVQTDIFSKEDEDGDTYVSSFSKTSSSNEIQLDF